MQQILLFYSKEGLISCWGGFFSLQTCYGGFNNFWCDFAQSESDTHDMS